MTLLIKNGNVFYHNRFEELDVYIDEHKRLTLAQSIDIDADETIDASGLHIMPGFIDTHVHLREPGFEYKETIQTGTYAAAKGGYTTVFCMPNLKPVTDSVETYLAIQKQIKENACIQVYPYVAITKQQKGEQIVDIDAISKHSLFFSDDGKGVQDESLMLEAMSKAQAVNAMIVAHCEDESLLVKGGSVHDGLLVEKFNQVGISSASEYKQIERDLNLVAQTHVQYHVCHISTKEGVDLIRKAKQVGLNVSCEVTPHHLLLSEHDVVVDDGNYKMNPPLRTKEDQKALLEGILDGTIEIIATDHAPHAQEEKSQGLKASMMGIIGSELAFSLLYTKLVKTNQLSLEKLVQLMSDVPANIFGIDGGYIDQDEVANLCIINLKDQQKITEKSLASKSKNTPFIGEHVHGINYMTICNGKIVYRKGI
ncbi:MAG: dihydroorotase [Erysipelotrichaceae bacterium]